MESLEKLEEKYEIAKKEYEEKKAILDGAILELKEHIIEEIRNNLAYMDMRSLFDSTYGRESRFTRDYLYNRMWLAFSEKKFGFDTYSSPYDLDSISDFRTFSIETLKRTLEQIKEYNEKYHIMEEYEKIKEREKNRLEVAEAYIAKINEEYKRKYNL